MTHATKAIYKLLLTDYVKVSKVSVEDMLYDEQDILRSMDKIEVSWYFNISIFLSLGMYFRLEDNSVQVVNLSFLMSLFPT